MMQKCFYLGSHNIDNILWKLDQAAHMSGESHSSRLARHSVYRANRITHGCNELPAIWRDTQNNASAPLDTQFTQYLLEIYRAGMYAS
jgi:hypothetical protein